MKCPNCDESMSGGGDSGHPDYTYYWCNRCAEEFEYERDGLYCMDNYELRDYQVEGVKFLFNGGYNCDEMGLGKTLTTLHILETRKQLPVLILLPKFAFSAWYTQINKFFDKEAFIYEGTIKQRDILWHEFHADGYDYMICSYAMLPEIREKTKKLVAVLAGHGETFKWQQLVCDEIHMNHVGLLNNKTDTYKQVREFCIESKIRPHLITGSPFRQTPIDFYAPLSIIDPDNYRSKWSFIRKHGVYEENRFGKKLTRGVQNMDLFRAEIRKYMLRRYRKDHLLEIPGKTREPIILRIAGEQKRIYNDLIKEMMAQTEEDFIIAPNAISRDLKLRQLLISPKILGGKTKGVLLDTLLDMTESLVYSNSPFCVYTPYRKAAELIIAELRNKYKDITVSYIRGQMKGKQIIDEVAKFQDTPNDHPKVLVGIIDACVSFDAYVASTCFFLGVKDNDQMNKQAEDRLDRMGQLNAVMCYYLLAQDTIHDVIRKRLNSKTIAGNWILSTEDMYQYYREEAGMSKKGRKKGFSREN